MMQIIIVETVDFWVLLLLNGFGVLLLLLLFPSQLNSIALPHRDESTLPSKLRARV
jgi:hypothetical protein